ncbi:MAG: transposase [Candidatus Thiodiazotropha sp. 6PLUC2]
MSNYKRYPVAGGIYFFTVVTFNRRPLFADPLARQCLRNAILETGQKMPFTTLGFCLLPDHLHCIWSLPEGDSDFSLRWNRVKGKFSKRYLAAGGIDGGACLSRRKRGEVAIWQRRFWEHSIRDESDLTRHLDYLHYNPVKHGLVGGVGDWPWSTFHRFVSDGTYPVDWCGNGICDEVMDSVGE